MHAAIAKHAAGQLEYQPHPAGKHTDAGMKLVTIISWLPAELATDCWRGQHGYCMLHLIQFGSNAVHGLKYGPPRPQPHGAAFVGGGALRHEHNCWVLCGGLKLNAVGIRHAQNVPSKVDHSHLHPQADTQEGLCLHRSSQRSAKSSSEQVTVALFLFSLSC